MANSDYLAAEIQEDGRTIKCTWPDDPLIAQRLFAELEYQFKIAIIEATAKQAREIKDAMDKRVHVADPIALNGLAKHTRS